MEKQTLARRIEDILSEAKRLVHDIEALQIADMEYYPENYEKLSIDAAIHGERIACRLRHLIYTTTSVMKPAYFRKASGAHDISIIDEDGYIQVTLPSLLPKRRPMNTEFMTEPLYYALTEYSEANALHKYKECVVCFTHVYAKSLPKRRIRDYDNIELKHILDVVAAFIMTDDSGILCDAYSTTELDETDCTRITIMDREQFPGWLKKHQSVLKSISDFY